jgi:hypothetical protein
VENLKNNFPDNHLEIFRLEREATTILDEKLQSKVSSLKIFENLNFERPTPLFLTLTKNTSLDKLANIRDDQGREFPDEEARNKYCT